jgi:hypothetical protein
MSNSKEKLGLIWRQNDFIASAIYDLRCLLEQESKDYICSTVVLPIRRFAILAYSFEADLIK